jgi:hypothetical protein
MSWDRRFADPIELPGRRLITLRDAALYITKLPKAEHDIPEWQAAMEALLLVAENGGPPMFARIGVMRALNRNAERTLIHRARRNIGDSGSWRAIDDSPQLLRGPAALRSSTEAFMLRSEKLSNDGPQTPALGTSTHDQENNASAEVASAIGSRQKRG